jgi:hypothetical protein
MTYIRKRLVRIDISKPPPGRIDPSRMGKPRSPTDTERYPVITDEDREATRRLAREEIWPRVTDPGKPPSKATTCV